MRTPKFRIASAVRIETRQGGIGNPRWMALLGAIPQTRSITAAARAAGLSYKAAWDAIDAMNNLAGKPVVATSVGGRGGGGARLTARGLQLLTAYQAVEAENVKFVARMNAGARAPAADLQLLDRLALRTSARNQWAGKVARIARGSVNDEVEVRLPGGERIVAVVTHESTENLGLKTGREAFVLVNSTSVMLATGPTGALQLSARNQLRGTVARVTPGAVNTEIVIALRGGTTVAAVVTNVAASDMGISPGLQATAIFKASAVIVGVR